MMAQPLIDYEALSDLELANRIALNDMTAARLIIQRNNQRLFRTAWSILKNRSEAEDAVQSTYLHAFSAIKGFHGRSSLSTWLTRIAINEALGLLRTSRRRRAQLDDASVIVMDEYREKLMGGSMTLASSDGTYARKQIREMLESAIAQLSPNFRLVFILREIEGLSVEETAEAIGIPPSTVKTRYLRARRQLQRALDPELKTALLDTFPFAGVDCEALTTRVLQRLSEIGNLGKGDSTND
jgi:RNA polymerase sigma-70 factor (ECF subfamily)